MAVTVTIPWGKTTTESLQSLQIVFLLERIGIGIRLPSTHSSTRLPGEFQMQELKRPFARLRFLPGHLRALAGALLVDQPDKQQDHPQSHRQNVRRPASICINIACLLKISATWNVSCRSGRGAYNAHDVMDFRP